MKKYQEIEMETPENFKRMTGLSKENFQTLCDKTETYIEDEKKRNPLKKRGIKKSELSLKDRILLTIYYLKTIPLLQIWLTFLIIVPPIATKFILVTQEFLSKLKLFQIAKNYWKIHRIR
jgi:hypothetical protein